MLAHAKGAAFYQCWYWYYVTSHVIQACCGHMTWHVTQACCCDMLMSHTHKHTRHTICTLHTHAHAPSYICQTAIPPQAVLCSTKALCHCHLNTTHRTHYTHTTHPWSHRHALPVAPSITSCWCSGTTPSASHKQLRDEEGQKRNLRKNHLVRVLKGLRLPLKSF